MPAVNTSDAILLVEDDERDVILLQHALKEAGLTNQLIVVRNGLEAADYLDGYGLYTDRAVYPLPRLVLLDLNMPRMDGFEVLAWLYTRADLKDITVIVLSGSAEESDMHMARQLRANDYLVKPREAREWAKLTERLSAHLSKPPAPSRKAPNSTNQLHEAHDG